MATLTRGTSEESTRHLVVPARLRVLTQTAHAIGTVAKQAKGNEMIPALASPSQNEEKAESILSMGSIANKRLRNPTGIQMTDAMMGREARRRRNPPQSASFPQSLRASSTRHGSHGFRREVGYEYHTSSGIQRVTRHEGIQRFRSSHENVALDCRRQGHRIECWHRLSRRHGGDRSPCDRTCLRARSTQRVMTNGP